VAVVAFMVVAVVVAMVVVHIFVAAVIVAVVVAAVVLMVAAVVVLGVMAVVVATMIATSTSPASGSTSTATASCFRVFGVFVFCVFGSYSLFCVSWSIGFIILFILIISGIGSILRCFIVRGIFFLSIITSLSCISLWAIASSISRIIGCSVTSRGVLISLHMRDQISRVRTLAPFLWRRQSRNIKKQE